jgi:hypothetical protein
MMIYTPYQNNHNWIGAMLSFMGVMVMGIFMVAVSKSITKSLFEPEEKEFAYLPGVIAMPRIPKKATRDFFFMEYVRDMVRLGERLSDEDVKFMWEGWKKSREEDSLRQEVREFCEKYKRDPLSDKAIREFDQIEARAKATGLSDREFERLWTAEVERYYEAPGYLPQVIPEQIELMERYLELARDLAKSAREASK